MNLSKTSTQYNSKIHPKKFALLLGLGSVVMMFAGLTSAFLVRRAAGNWVEYKIPELFLLSTIVIIVSSIVIQLAYTALKKQKYNYYKLGLGATLILGIIFCVLQYFGWQELTNIGIRLTGNPSGSFLYVISGIHVIHVLGGMVFLLAMFLISLKKLSPANILIRETNLDEKERYLGIELMMTYWHFIGILWIYLYLFFSYYAV